MYRVVKDFADLEDHEHIYREGDTFPRPGVDVSEERIRELLTGRNRTGKVLIEEITTQGIKEPISAPEELQGASEAVREISEPKEEALEKPKTRGRRAKPKNAG